MRIIILYHPKSDHNGLVQDYATEFERYKRKKIELISLETVEGSELANLYGITTYPATLAIAGDGTLQRLWQGSLLPLMDELSYYADEPQGEPISHLGRTVRLSPA